MITPITPKPRNILLDSLDELLFLFYRIRIVHPKVELSAEFLREVVVDEDRLRMAEVKPSRRLGGEAGHDSAAVLSLGHIALDAIPDEVEADVSGMELGDSLHVRDLPVPSGVEFNMDDELTIATVLVPRGLKDGEGEVAEVEGEEEGAAEDGDDATDEKSADGESK